MEQAMRLAGAWRTWSPSSHDERKLESELLSQLSLLVKIPFGKSRLKRSIERGLAQGNLSEALEELGDVTLKTRADAQDLLWGLQQLEKVEAAKLGEAIGPLVSLFQDVDGKAAFDHLREHGIPRLIGFFDEIVEVDKDDESGVLLLILKMSALFGTFQGALKIIEEAHRPLRQDAYMWSVILGIFKSDHPESEFIYRSFQDRLPPDFIGVSLLDAANACLIGGGTISHPFDTQEGKQRLGEWLAAEAESSYAHSATASLPFIGSPERDELLKLAMEHSDAGVKIEAAWASAKVGRADGLARLTGFCGDVNHAQTAARYLSELKREDLIPASAKEPGFVALSEFSQWLAHPCELGRAPDELEIVDHRILEWPPERESKPFWLVKYRLKDVSGLGEDDVNCGLVGSMTFCLFSYQLAQRPAEDCYAIHCYWEMEHAKLIQESDVRDDAKDYETMLKQWTRGTLEGARLLLVAELAPELQQAQRLVGLASARFNGSEGWVVLDGDRSEWYPREKMPTDTHDSVVLKIHVGRHLLGFHGKLDRSEHLLSPAPEKSPDAIVASYEKLLLEAGNRKGKAQGEALDFHGPVGKYFEQYAAALMETGGERRLDAVIRSVAPYWDHNAGYGKLGRAAFDCGNHPVAEEYFLKLLQNYKDSHRSPEVALLAEIWCARGDDGNARKLLVDCLGKLIAESKSATGSDKQLFEKWFQNQRQALLKLFPTEMPALCEEYRIPASTLI